MFNPTAVEKREPVELTVWDWLGNLRRVRVTGADGAPLEFQLLDHGQQEYWSHKFFRVLVYVTV